MRINVDLKQNSKSESRNPKRDKGRGSGVVGKTPSSLDTQYSTLFLLLDHLDLFRISDFELRIFSYPSLPTTAAPFSFYRHPSAALRLAQSIPSCGLRPGPHLCRRASIHGTGCSRAS